MLLQIREPEEPVAVERMSQHDIFAARDGVLALYMAPAALVLATTPGGIAEVAITVRGHKLLIAMPSASNSRAMPSVHKLIPILEIV